MAINLRKLISFAVGLVAKKKHETEFVSLFRSTEIEKKVNDEPQKEGKERIEKNSKIKIKQEIVVD